MKTFLIKFFYGTDLQIEHKITSFGEMQALSYALLLIGKEAWVTVPHTKITIELAP